MSRYIDKKRGAAKPDWDQTEAKQHGRSRRSGVSAMAQGASGARSFSDGGAGAALRGRPSRLARPPGAALPALRTATGRVRCPRDLAAVRRALRVDADRSL